MSLVWEEPPARPRAEVTLQDQLRGRPGVWAKVMTATKVEVSRLGGELHRQGFDINMTDKPDDEGAYSLYAQWNAGERTTTIVRPGSEHTVSSGTLLDTALTHLLTDLVRGVERRLDPAGGPQHETELEDLCSEARHEVKVLFSGPDAVHRYLRGVQAPVS